MNKIIETSDIDIINKLRYLNIDMSIKPKSSIKEIYYNKTLKSLYVVNYWTGIDVYENIDDYNFKMFLNDSYPIKYLQNRITSKYIPLKYSFQKVEIN